MFELKSSNEWLTAAIEAQCLVVSCSALRADEGVAATTEPSPRIIPVSYRRASGDTVDG